jgi:hypothetical protein
MLSPSVTVTLATIHVGMRGRLNLDEPGTRLLGYAGTQPCRDKGSYPHRLQVR